MVSAVNIAMMNLEEFLPDSVINETYEKKKNEQYSKKLQNVFFFPYF